MRDQAHTSSGRKPITPEDSAPTPVTLSDGQKADHWVLPAEERAQGYVRPIRRSYVHVTCGAATTMPAAVAETYARQPGFYGSTFCCACGDYFPVGLGGEFVWDERGEKVGS